MRNYCNYKSDIKNIVVLSCGVWRYRVHHVLSVSSSAERVVVRVDNTAPPIATSNIIITPCLSTAFFVFFVYFFVVIF